MCLPESVRIHRLSSMEEPAICVSRRFLFYRDIRTRYQKFNQQNIIKKKRGKCMERNQKFYRVLRLAFLFVVLYIASSTACHQSLKTVKAQTKELYLAEINEEGKLQMFIADTEGNKHIVKNTYLAIKKTGNNYLAVKPDTPGSVIYFFDNQGTGKKYTKEGAVKITYYNISKTMYIKNGILYTGPLTIGKDSYYCVKGIRVKGWKKINGKYYYFNSSYKLQRNTIVGSKAKGYFYVDQSGVKVTAPEIKYAVTFVMKNSNSSLSNKERLKQCFQAMCQYKYLRFIGDNPSAQNMASYARYMFTYKHGNCYRYASAMAYIARVLGFGSRVAVGAVTAHSTGPLSPHGWCEILDGKTWKMIDCSMQNAHKDKNLFMVTRQKYPFRLRCDKINTMNTSSGKIVWK